MATEDKSLIEMNSLWNGITQVKLNLVTLLQHFCGISWLSKV